MKSIILIQPKVGCLESFQDVPLQTLYKLYRPFARWRVRHAPFTQGRHGMGMTSIIWHWDAARGASRVRTGLIAIALTLSCAGDLSAQAPPVTSAAAPQSKLAANTAGPVTVETLPAMTALVLPTVGSYAQTPQAIARLMTYVMPKGVVRGAPFGLYYDDPSTVAADSLRWEIGVPVPEGTVAEAPFVVRAMPAIEAAVMLCTGPFEGTAPCYGALTNWAAANGYVLTTPVQEHWLSDPSTVAPEQFQTRLVFPVARRRTP